MKNKNIFQIILTIAAVGLFAAIAYQVKNSPNQERQTAVQQNAQINDHDSHHSNETVLPQKLDDLLNQPAPDFSFADRNGNVYSKENLKGKNVVLFFNEGLMCYPACWNQIAAFAKDDNLKTSDTAILSVVVDSKEEWQKAIDKMPELGQAIVVFDANAAASNAFNMLKTESSMHYGSLPGHTYIIVDKEGIVRHIFDDANMALHNNQLAEELKKIN